MTDATATVLAAIIAVIGTIIVTKFDDIANLLRRSTWNIKGEWEENRTHTDGKTKMH
jgi:hypothetical protein